MEGEWTVSTLNVVILSGNLTRAPELRKTPGGLAVTDLGLAVNERYKSQGGEEVKKTCFVDVTVWGKTAESCAKSLRKGSPALVEGRLQFDQWEAQDGGKRSKLRVVADRVRFLAPPERTEADDAAEPDDDRAFDPEPRDRGGQGQRRPAPRDARSAR